MTVEGYVAKVAALAEEIGPINLDVYKRIKNTGNMSKVGTLSPSDIEPDKLEPFIVQTWGAGLFQLRPTYDRQYYAPGSTFFRVGDEQPEESGGALTRAVPSSTEDVNAAIIEATRQVGNVAALAALKKATKEEEKPKESDEMNMATVQAMITASQAPLLQMLQNAENRAQRAEERNEKLMEKMLDHRAAVQGPMLGEVLKSVVSKPETLSLLMGGNDPAPNEWIGLIKEVAQGLAPVVQGLVMQWGAQMGSRGAAPAAPARVAVPPAIPHGGRAPSRETDELRPTGAGAPVSGSEEGGSVPMQLTEEQTMAKENLVAFIRAGDFPNAFATLESFPGFAPTAQGGAMPLGQFIVGQIDPAVNPKVYVPQLYMLVPEVKEMQRETEAFIKWAQDKIVADDDAAAQEANRGSR